MVEQLLRNLWVCFKKFMDPEEENRHGRKGETNPDIIVRSILADENPVENIGKWADKNLDKLDKCLVIQNGQWFAKGQTGTRPDGSIKKFDGAYVIQEAIHMGNVECVKILQHKGARVDYRRENGDTALIEAIHMGLFDMAKHILSSPEIEDKKAYVNIAGEANLTALYHACHPLEANKVSAKCLEWLIEQGANMDHRCLENGFSVLHWAAKESATGVQIAALLKAGFPVDTVLSEPGGQTALHISAVAKNLKTAAALMNAGISPYTRNSLGETPVSLALSLYPIASSVVTADRYNSNVRHVVTTKSFGEQFKELAESMSTNPMQA
jgi:ankyrin repeat protein